MNEETKDAEETQGHERPWTPGPWSPFDYVECSDVTCAKGFFVTRVATTKGLECFTPLDTIRANARLIAAAPELFEALDRLKKESEHCFHGTSYEVIRQAEAALAKAIGGQP